jgi:hypothetical protein
MPHPAYLAARPADGACVSRRARLYISVLPVLVHRRHHRFSRLAARHRRRLHHGAGAGLYLLRIPGNVVIGTSLLQVVAMMAATTILHAVQSQSVDILLAFCLMVGGTVGAQFGASAGKYLRGEQLRALLALLVLAVAIRFGFSLILAPADPYSTAVIGASGVI